MKKRLLALLLALVCVCLSGCSQMQDKLLDMMADKAAQTGADALAQQFIDGLLANDAEMSHAVFVEGVELTQVLEVFPQMRAILPEESAYTLTPISWNSNTGNGVTQTAFQFLLTMGEQQFVVETQQVSTMEGLYNIHIAPYTAQESTETIVQEHPALDAVCMLVSVATVCFVIWALVDCCRHKISRKWLWVLAILLGNVMLLLTLNGAKLNFNLQLGLHLNATALKLRDGGFYLSLMVPAGSIAYLIHRKHLLASASSKGFAETFPESAPEAPGSSEQT